MRLPHQVIYVHVHHQYLMNELPISATDKQRDLGIIISSDLSWSYHISKIVSKAYKILGLLRRTLNDITTKKRLYISLVRSQLMTLYGSQIWRPLLVKDMKPIESLQRRAKKYIIILNDFTSSYRSRLIQLKLLPISMQLELNDSYIFLLNH